MILMHKYGNTTLVQRYIEPRVSKIKFPNGAHPQNCTIQVQCPEKYQDNPWSFPKPSVNKVQSWSEVPSQWYSDQKLGRPIQEIYIGKWIRNNVKIIPKKEKSGLRKKHTTKTTQWDHHSNNQVNTKLRVWKHYHKETRTISHKKFKSWKVSVKYT